MVALLDGGDDEVMMIANGDGDWDGNGNRDGGGEGWGG